VGLSMNIIVKEKEAKERFLSGKSVFQIFTIVNDNPIDKSLAITKEDYEKKLVTHEYISLLHIAPIQYQLSYLYDCLNRVKGQPRQEIFVFYIRDIGTKVWSEWFRVTPYTD
jgi:hypothetical protein